MLKPRSIPFGLLSLAAAFAGLVCWFPPFSPALFLFGVAGLQLISLLLAIVAGFCNSRWWFLAVAIPLFFIVFMVPQYEQSNEISLKGSISEGVTFKLSGTGRIVSFGVGTYSADAQEPNDRRFLLWQIEPAQHTPKGKDAWEIGTIKYGVVPDSYRQTFPEQDARPAALQPGKIYYVADHLVHRYFEMTNGRPKWVSSPPAEPCFVIQNGDKWLRVPCNPR